MRACVRACGRAGDRNAGYEVTCFTLTHINHFPSQSFVCVSHRNHINQRPWQSTLCLRTAGRQTMADMRNIGPPKTLTRLAFSLCTSPVIRHWHYTKPECKDVMLLRHVLQTYPRRASFQFLILNHRQWQKYKVQVKLFLCKPCGGMGCVWRYSANHS